jgi:hypothetical protein
MIHLLPEERETIISWCDDDDMIFVHSTQRRMMTKLRKNPSFKLQDEHRIDGRVVGIDGHVPLGFVTIRSKKKSRKPLTVQEKENFRERMKKNINHRTESENPFVDVGI